MRHNVKKTTLGRRAAPRRALFRSLAEGLVLHGAIKTTEAKAKALRRVVEPLVTKAKKNTLAARRRILRVLYTEKAVKKLMEEIGPRYKDRQGGYTRIIKLGQRVNDAAPMARIEFV